MTPTELQVQLKKKSYIFSLKVLDWYQILRKPIQLLLFFLIFNFYSD